MELAEQAVEALQEAMKAVKLGSKKERREYEKGPDGTLKRLKCVGTCNDELGVRAFAGVQRAYVREGWTRLLLELH